MTKDEICRRIAERFAIDELNPMQIEMLQSSAPSIILSAPTGSGKTIAFTTRLLANLQPPMGRVQAIVIAPSRELVLQISEVVRQLATGYKTVALYGGHSMADEKNSLTPLPDIIIATPGRLLDHMQRGHLDIHGLDTLVLDEYDKSLELGFEGEMRRIVSRLGHIGCIILTSATMLDELPGFMPVKSLVKLDYSSSTDPRSRMQTVEVRSFSRDKIDTLVELLKSLPAGDKTIVFVNHRESAERVYKRLRHDRIAATLYHGGLDQQQREMAIDMFANGSAPVIVATDLAARGLDIEAVGNVIHYHLPVDRQAWTHRNGRTARVDNSGTIYAITSEADNLADYITFDRTYQPSEPTDADLSARLSSLYISAGKKEKISKADVAGFVAASSVTHPSEVGKIALHDHYAIVAVPSDRAQATAAALGAKKLKGKKVRISIVKL